MTQRIFILHCADGSRHAFDNRDDLAQSVSMTYAQFGQTTTAQRGIVHNLYYVAGVCVARDEVIELKDRPDHL